MVEKHSRFLGSQTQRIIDKQSKSTVNQSHIVIQCLPQDRKLIEFRLSDALDLLIALPALSLARGQNLRSIVVMAQFKLYLFQVEVDGQQS
jgi:hypothetical protein